MAGQPRLTAKRMRRLLDQLGELGDQFTKLMPRIYQDPARPVYGAACVFWQTAANALADHYVALRELAAHLNDKAGYVDPKTEEREPKLDLDEVTEATVMEFDGESKSLGEWCEIYKTPIGLAKERAAAGADWEVAIVLGPEEAVENKEL